MSDRGGAGPLAGRRSAGSATVVRLDPAQPFLDDHRPGGAPLFGTVMGIEAMAEAARALCDPPGEVSAIEDVAIGPPCILAGDAPAEIAVEVVPDGDGPAAYRCALTSLRDGATVRHFAGRVVIGGTEAPPSAPAPPAAILPGTPAEEIYRLFFHGPSLRVVGRAHRVPGGMLGELARGLPPGHVPADAPTSAAPRLVELCLQTAGLLELATSGRMMIPRAIARIERYCRIDADHPGALVAEARHGSAGIDVVLRDERQTVCLRVLGYETAPLPFAADERAVVRLRDAVRGPAGAPSG